MTVGRTRLDAKELGRVGCLERDEASVDDRDERQDYDALNERDDEKRELASQRDRLLSGQ